jgi:hypothetical protein
MYILRNKFLIVYLYKIIILNFKKEREIIMKKIKLISVILAIVMLFSLVTVAFAAPATGTGSITITNAIKDQTYNVYKLFELYSFVKDDNKDPKEPYCYLITNEWKDFFMPGGKGAEFVTIGNSQADNLMVTWNDNADPADLADLADLAVAVLPDSVDFEYIVE